MIIITWGENPRWFWPDGTHPNHHGHKKLYEFLKEDIT
jgi:lysophospholipase L1-like esterase